MKTSRASSQIFSPVLQLNHAGRRLGVFSLAVIALALLVGCSTTPKVNPANTGRIRFEFIHKGHKETFFAETSDPALIAKVRKELGKPPIQRTLHIHGKIAAGSDGVNGPWHWHYVADQWGLTEISMELCDGWPSYIEANLDEWLKSVGSFCPWDSRVVREL